MADSSLKRRFDIALETIEEICNTELPQLPQPAEGEDRASPQRLKLAQQIARKERDELSQAIQELNTVRDKWTHLIERVTQAEREVLAQSQAQFELQRNDRAQVVRTATRRLRDLDRLDMEISVWVDMDNETMADQLNQSRLDAMQMAAQQAEALQATTAQMVEAMKIKASGLKISPMKLMPFSGGKTEWVNWWPLFEIGIHNNDRLSKVEKLLELKSLVRDNAKKLLAGIQTIDEASYDTAIMLMKQAYQDKEAVVRELNNQLFRIPAGTSFEDDQKLLIEANKIVQMLNANGQNMDANPAICQLLEQKLSQSTLRQLFKAKRDNIGTWTTSLFLKKLQESIQNEEAVRDAYAISHPRERKEKDSKGSAPKGKPTIQAATSEQKNGRPAKSKSQSGKNEKAGSGKKSNPPRAKPQGNQSQKKQPSPKWPCIFCEKQGHWPAECRAYQSIAARTEQLTKKQRCFKCFSPNHSSRFCPKLVQCWHCKKKGHNVALCHQKMGEKQSTQSTQQGEEVHLSEDSQICSTRVKSPKSVQNQRTRNDLSESSPEDKSGAEARDQKKLFLSAMVPIFNPKKPRNMTDALIVFDSASERSYISERIARQLDLEAKNPLSVDLTGFAGIKLGSHTMALTSVGLKTEKGDQIIHPERTAKVLRPMMSYSAQELDSDALFRARLCPPNIRAPDLMIGVEYFNDFLITPETELPSGFWISTSIVGKMISGGGKIEDHQTHSVNVIQNIWSIMSTSQKHDPPQMVSEDEDQEMKLIKNGDGECRTVRVKKGKSKFLLRAANHVYPLEISDQKMDEDELIYSADEYEMEQNDHSSIHLGSDVEVEMEQDDPPAVHFPVDEAAQKVSSGPPSHPDVRTKNKGPVGSKSHSDEARKDRRREFRPRDQDRYSPPRTRRRHNSSEHRRSTYSTSHSDRERRKPSTSYSDQRKVGPAYRDLATSYSDKRKVSYERPPAVHSDEFAEMYHQGTSQSAEQRAETSNRSAEPPALNQAVEQPPDGSIQLREWSLHHFCTLEGKHQSCQPLWSNEVCEKISCRLRINSLFALIASYYAAEHTENFDQVEEEVLTTLTHSRVSDQTVRWFMEKTKQMAPCHFYRGFKDNKGRWQTVKYAGPPPERIFQKMNGHGDRLSLWWRCSELEQLTSIWAESCMVAREELKNAAGMAISICRLDSTLHFQEIDELVGQLETDVERSIPLSLNANARFAVAEKVLVADNSTTSMATEANRQAAGSKIMVVSKTDIDSWKTAVANTIFAKNIRCLVLWHGGQWIQQRLPFITFLADSNNLLSRLERAGRKALWACPPVQMYNLELWRTYHEGFRQMHQNNVGSTVTIVFPPHSEENSANGLVNADGTLTNEGSVRAYSFFQEVENRPIRAASPLIQIEMPHVVQVVAPRSIRAEEQQPDPRPIRAEEQQPDPRPIRAEEQQPDPRPIRAEEQQPVQAEVQRPIRAESVDDRLRQWIASSSSKATFAGAGPEPVAIAPDGPSDCARHETVPFQHFGVEIRPERNFSHAQVQVQASLPITVAAIVQDHVRLSANANSEIGIKEIHKLFKAFRSQSDKFAADVALAGQLLEESDQKRCEKAQFQEKLQEALIRNWKACHVSKVGSFAAKLDIVGSDLDLVVCPQNTAQNYDRQFELDELHGMKRTVWQSLRRELTQAIVINATVPILTLSTKSGLKIDMTYNRPESIRHVRELTKIADANSEFSILFRILKQWTKIHQLTSVKGHPSSIAVSLMLDAWLTNLSEKHPNGKKKYSIGELLVGFFDFWSGVKTANVVVQRKENRTEITPRLQEEMGPLLFVRNPVDGTNMAKTIVKDDFFYKCMLMRERFICQKQPPEFSKLGFEIQTSDQDVDRQGTSHSDRAIRQGTSYSDRAKVTSHSDRTSQGTSNSDRAETIVPSSNRMSNSKTGTRGPSIIWTLMSIVVLALQISLAMASPKGAMLCHPSIRQYSKLTSRSICQDFLNSAKFSFPLHVHLPNRETMEIEAAYCTLIFQKIEYWKNIIGERRNNTSPKILATSREECLRMWRSRSCLYGPLSRTRKGTFHSSNQFTPPIDYSYFSTKNGERTNCFLTETSIFFHTKSKKVYSPLGDMNQCQVEDGSCPLESGGILVWLKPKEREICEYVLADQWKGHYHVSDRIWTRADDEIAISFTNVSILSTCDQVFAITDQNFAIPEAEYRDLEKLEKSASKPIGQSSIPDGPSAPARGRRELVRTEQLAAQLTAEAYASISKLKVATCGLQSRSWELSLLPSMDATQVARSISKQHYLQARWVQNGAEPILEYWRCTPVPSQRFAFIASSRSDCSEQLPVNLTIHGESLSSYLDTQTLIISPSSKNGSCAIFQKQAFILEDELIEVDQATGSVRKIPRDRIQSWDLIGQDQQLPHLSPLIFHNLELTNDSDAELIALKWFSTYRLAQNPQAQLIDKPESREGHWTLPSVPEFDLWRFLNWELVYRIVALYVLAKIAHKFILRPYLIRVLGRWHPMFRPPTRDEPGPRNPAPVVAMPIHRNNGNDLQDALREAVEVAQVRPSSRLSTLLVLAMMVGIFVPLTSAEMVTEEVALFGPKGEFQTENDGGDSSEWTRCVASGTWMAFCVVHIIRDLRRAQAAADGARTGGTEGARAPG